MSTETLTDIAGDYTLDASHSRLGFSARHAMVTKVRGQFADFEGTAHVNTTTPADSTVSVTIRPASISTGNEDRDNHLRSGDFFEVESFPTWTFTSTDVSRDGSTWTIAGDLTLKDVTKPVSIDFEETGSATDPFGYQRVGFEGELTVNRKDFGLTWNAALETGGVLVSDKIKLDFDLSAVKTA